MNQSAKKFQSKYPLLEKARDVLECDVTITADVCSNVITKGVAITNVGSYLTRGRKVHINKVTYEKSTFRFYFSDNGNKDIKHYITASNVSSIQGLSEAVTLLQLETLKDMAKASIKKYEAVVADVTDKQDFMVLNNIEVFDENLYKTYKILQQIKENPNMDILEQSKLITKLVS